jgi:hypothetical protein
MYKKGECGNPNGRPKKGQAITEILNFELDELDAEKNILIRHRIAQKLIELAEGGDLQAIRYIFDRVDGKPRETRLADTWSIGGIEFEYNLAHKTGI